MSGRPVYPLGQRPEYEEEEEEEEEENMDSGRKRRQTWMLMEDMDTFNELQFILQEVCIQCETQNFYTNLLD